MISASFLAGAIAGGVAKTSIAPLDRTKIHFQIHDSKYSLKEALKFLRNTYSQHGITALWRGNSATMVRILPYSAIQFGSHEQFKKWLDVDTNKKKKERKFRSFLAGSSAGLVSTIFVYPLDVARARMAVSNSDKIRIIDVLKTMVNNGGYLALYRGCLPSLMGIALYAGSTFSVYEHAKRYHHELTGDERPQFVVGMGFGALAGLIGQSFSYPLDVVRRRMQTSDIKLGMKETTIRLLRDSNPLLSLYKGLSLNWVKGPIATGVSFATFEFYNKTLKEFMT